MRIARVRVLPPNLAHHEQTETRLSCHFTRGSVIRHQKHCIPPDNARRSGDEPQHAKPLAELDSTRLEVPPLDTLVLWVRR